jgi:hypothetical protein
MKKTTMPKLGLHKESLRQLDQQEIQVAAGGLSGLAHTSCISNSVCKGLCY